MSFGCIKVFADQSRITFRQIKIVNMRKTGLDRAGLA